MSLTIGQRIKESGEALQISQAALAKAIGVDQSTVALWETGRTPPRRSKIADLAAFLKETQEYLQFGTSTSLENPQTVPMAGYIRGDGVLAYHGNSPQTIELPTASSTDRRQKIIRCFTVDKDSVGFLPLYRPGDILFLIHRHAPQDAIGIDALITKQDGSMLLGMIASAGKTCSVIRPNGALLQNVDIDFAEPVFLVQKNLIQQA